MSVTLLDSPRASEVGAGKSKVQAEKTPDNTGRSGTPGTGCRNAERDRERDRTPSDASDSSWNTAVRLSDLFSRKMGLIIIERHLARLFWGQNESLGDMCFTERSLASFTVGPSCGPGTALGA